MTNDLYRTGSAVLVLAAGLAEKKLIKPGVDKRRLRSLCDLEQLYDTYWLAAYELGIADVLPKGDKHILADPCFQILRKADVKFFDFEIKPEPLFSVVKEIKEEAYESDDDLSESFEFNPASDTYKVTSDDEEETDEEEF
jgi:hypothetical protein